MRIALLTSATPSPQAAAVNAPCAAQPAADSTSYLVRPATHVHVDVSPLARRAGVPERCGEPYLPCTTLLLSRCYFLQVGADQCGVMCVEPVVTSTLERAQMREVRRRK